MSKAVHGLTTAVREPHPAVLASPVLPAVEPEILPSLQPHAPGVVFGLPAAAYHADPSLGSSDIKRLLRSAMDYWWHSALNPNCEPAPDSPAKLKGRALHKIVLEGEEAFEKTYIGEPTPADFPGCLVTLEDLKTFCRSHGEKVSGTKAELSKLVRNHDPRIPIFDEQLAKFEQFVQTSRLEVLKPRVMAEVREAAATIGLNPHLAKAFSGGVAEVSVFWVENGVPLKSRLDLLKPRTIVDLKSFTNSRERSVDQAIAMAIAEYRYDIAARHYLDGYAQLLKAARAGRVFGNCPLEKNWPTTLEEPSQVRFTWVFHQCEGAPVTKGVDIAADCPALNRATREIAQAKRLYRDCLTRFGDKPWICDDPVRELRDTDLPTWLREDVEEAA